MTVTALEILIKVVLVIGGLMTAAAYLVLLERRIAAWVQDRRGPNRVGIPLTRVRLFGLGQPLADGVKFILKEEYTPGHVDRWLYLAAPILILSAALMVFAVIPFGSVLPTDFGIEGIEEPIPLVIAPGVDVGLLYVFAISSLAVYGVLLGGWASNNKYSFLGCLRSSAQLISYELPLGLGILGVVLAAGTLDLGRIMLSQAETGVWFAAAQPLGLLVFLIAAFAEAGRLPFDLAEAEQELVGGYHTEYSGIKLLLFLVSEFMHMIAASFLLVILFFGGWHFWGLTGSAENGVTWFQALARILVLMGKIFLVIVFFMLVRWSWPRFRFDQLMALAWKVMLPLGLVNFVTVAVVVEVKRTLGPDLLAWQHWLLALIPWLVLVASGVAVALFGPAVGDNRPRRGPSAFDVEAPLG